MSPPSSTSAGSANGISRSTRPAFLALDIAKDASYSRSRSTFSSDDFSPRTSQAPIWEEPRSNIKEKRDSKQSYTSRQRAQYYEEQFAYKGDVSSARDRVTRDSPIVADLRTNVILKDEFTLVTDLSQQLSQRYQRPESSIMITVNHSACILLGGSFEPTYLLTISALPVQLQPTTNKRNASMIQSFMYESIGVPAERGIVKFVPIQEECLATNGRTIRGDIERLERQNDEENSGLKQVLTRNSRLSAIGKAKSSMQLSRRSSKATDAPCEPSSPPSRAPGSPLDSAIAIEDERLDNLAPLQTEDGAQKRSLKSSSSKYFSREKIQASPGAKDDATNPRLGKRKSFRTLFTRK